MINKRFKNLFLLFSSILFYSWGAPLFIFVILGTTLLDFHLVKWMDSLTDSRSRKVLLVFSLCINLGLLFYFKYCNFFIDNLNVLLEAIGKTPRHFLSVVLPIGISFYTFESVTYVMDVYRRVHKPLNNFWHYQLYIILFPKLIAGPIIRYHEIAGQIENRVETNEKRLEGFYRFGIGLAKKVMIANVLAVKADEVFKMPADELTAAISWIGTLCYTFQIYFDFSGYSDMAIGLGKMMGFTFPENFSNPYSSGSITEFWRRWHITLGNWMRNYLYIPLGGNKRTRLRTYFNLWIVFLASGFWHGASWTFIIWGVYHGTFLALERLFLLKVFEKAGRFVSVLITFVLVAIGWVFFRADSLEHAFRIIRSLFSFDFSLPLFFADTRTVFYLLLAGLFSFFTVFKYGRVIQEKIFNGNYSGKMFIGLGIVVICLYFLSVAAITSGEENPFIYFRF